MGKWPMRYVFAVRVVLFLLGVVAVLLSNLITKSGSQPSLALFSAGIAVMAGSLASVLQSAFGTDLPSLVEERLGFQRGVYDKGLAAVHLFRGDDSVFERFESARSIDIMYATGKSCVFRYGAQIADAMVRRGCAVRVLVADPENELFKHKELTEALCPGTDIRGEVRDVIAHLNYLMREAQRHPGPIESGSLEVRMYRCSPTNSLVIVNEEIARHTPYLPYAHSSEVPIYDASGTHGELLKQYRKAFDRAWHHSSVAMKVDLANRTVESMDGIPD